MKKIILFIIIFSNSIYALVSFPKDYNSNTPIFLVLHGCKQNDEIIMKDSFFLDKAKEKVIFMVPSQSVVRNIDHCWNWFSGIGRSRTIGSEMSNLVAKLVKFKTVNNLIKNPVYVMGMSAGGAMTMNLMACYPEYFRGAAIHSGLAYKINNSLLGLTELIANPPRKKPGILAKEFRSCSKRLTKLSNKKYLLFHGTADERVHIGHMYAIENQILDSHDLEDDNYINQSNLVSFNENHYSPVNKFRYTKRVYNLLNNVVIKVFEINRLKHDWSGGAFRVDRNDPKGPDASDIILRNFLNNK